MNRVKTVKPKRRYDATRRRQRAEQTRRRILEAARRLFVERGYAGASVEAIAASAGVAAETVYGQFGSKASLLEAVLDVALVGDAEPVALLERPWMRAVREEPNAARRVAALARESRRILDRLGPVHAVMRGAALLEPQIAELARRHARRRLAGQATLVSWIAEPGGLRPGLDRADATAAYFAATSPELHHLFTAEVGWSGARYERWLRETLSSQLLP